MNKSNHIINLLIVYINAVLFIGITKVLFIINTSNEYGDLENSFFYSFDILCGIYLIVSYFVIKNLHKKTQELKSLFGVYYWITLVISWLLFILFLLFILLFTWLIFATPEFNSSNF